jgi:catechol 2,3-dioxygenase-like lactoylglutathione lyase family enzyme
MLATRKARAVGVHHVTLKVGDVEEALDFYGRLFEFELVDSNDSSAVLDFADQFLLLQKNGPRSDDGRHVGLVVDDQKAVQRALADAGIKPLPGPLLHFLDPWGNRVEIVCYD